LLQFFLGPSSHAVTGGSPSLSLRAAGAVTTTVPAGHFGGSASLGNLRAAGAVATTRPAFRYGGSAALGLSGSGSVATAVPDTGVTGLAALVFRASGAVTTTVPVGHFGGSAGLGNLRAAGAVATTQAVIRYGTAAPGPNVPVPTLLLAALGVVRTTIPARRVSGSGLITLSAAGAVTTTGPPPSYPTQLFTRAVADGYTTLPGASSGYSAVAGPG
jgi:hypothetical protein